MSSDIGVTVVFEAVISERDEAIRFSIQIVCSSTCLLFLFGMVGLRFFWRGGGRGYGFYGEFFIDNSRKIFGS